VSSAVSAPRAAWLLTRLRIRRQFNRIVSVARYQMASRDRRAASRTSPTLWLLTAFVGLSMLFSFTNLAYQTIANMEKTLGSVEVQHPDPSAGARKDTADSERSRPKLRRLPAAPGSVLPPGVLQGAAFETALLLITALLIALASRELTRPEWDLEWLVTLPLPLSTLLVSRLIERVLTNSVGLVALGPFLSVLAWTCGYRWSAPLLGFGFAFVLVFLVATAQLLVDTGLRLALSPPKLRNLHATISVVSMLPMFLAISMAMSEDSFVFGWLAAMPDWLKWLPTGLAVHTLAAADGGSAAMWTAVMLAEIVVLFVAGLALLQRQMRGGVVAMGTREAVARRPQVPRRADAPTYGRSLLSAVQRRELRLLGRDRTFMVQTLLIPALIVGMQVFFNARGGISFADAVEHPANLATIAFALAASTLMFSAFQTLNAEGQALWVLYCVPHSLESVLWQKAKLWAAVATIYPLVVFAIAIAAARDISLQFVGSAVIVLLGVPIFATIATALGVFACDPLAQDIQKRVRPTYLYLFMIIAALYAYAIYATSIWQRAALMILTALVAIALWQRARDQFDYLLDPSASPPPRVSVSDGLIAALIFFVLQAMAALGLTYLGGRYILPGNVVWIAFSIAGVTTFGLVRLIYWRARMAGIPRMLNDGVPRALLWGLLGGIAASLAGFAYIKLAPLLDLFPTLQPDRRMTDPATPLWLVALAVVAAPVFEEFIFRGLIFGGLRRTLGVATATLASAAIFAIVHPPASVIPVFVMGVCAALVYERTRMLAAPMLLHAVYNAAVLGFHWNLMR
jgi:membrane protease YdiL (CAAX protease family)